MAGTVYKSLQALASRPSVSLSQAGQSVTVRGAVPVGAYTANANGVATVLNPGGAANPIVVSDSFALLKWPAFTVIDDLALDLDVTDNTATPLVIFNVGVLLASTLKTLDGPTLMVLTALQAKVGGLFRNGSDPYQAASTAPMGGVRQMRTQAKPFDRTLGVWVSVGPGATPISQATAAATVLNRGRWQPSVAYALNDYLFLDNGQIQYVTTAGTSGTTEPNWASVKADTTTDGGVTWTAACPVIGLTARFRSVVQGS